MKIIIEGAGEVGSQLAKLLSHEKHEVTIIDPMPERLKKISEVADVATIQATESSIKAFHKAHMQNTDLFIAVNPYVAQHINIVSSVLAKGLGCKKVAARIDNEEFLTSENKLLFKEMGVDFLFHSEKITADEIIELLNHSESFENIDISCGDLKISVYKLEEDSPILDMKLAEFSALASDDDQQFRVIAMTRNGETIIPRPNIKFQQNDLLYIISKKVAIENIMRLLGKTTIKVNKLFILGASKIAKIVAEQLSHKVSAIKIVDSDKEKCLSLLESLSSHKHIHIVNGDGKDSDFLLDEGIRDYDAFISLDKSDENNILSCIMAKKLGVAHTIAEVENLEYTHLAEDLGVDALINKKMMTANRIFQLSLSGKSRMIKYMNGSNSEVLEYIVAPDAIITQKKLKDIDFPNGAIIGGVIRGNDSFIAVGDTLIEAYDKVIVFSMFDCVHEIDKFFK